MLYAKPTPHHGGVFLYGDYLDFEELYDALHTVIGEEEEYSSYQAVRIRILGLCYDIRHALMGNREFEFVSNGMDENKMKELAMIVPKKNLYIKFPVLWPEVLFLVMVLKDFILLYQKKSKQPDWDIHIATVHKFRAVVAEALQLVAAGLSFRRTLKRMTQEDFCFEDYTTQYVDILNSKFLAMNKEKRLKNITIMARRIAEKGEEYRKVREEIREEALRCNCSRDEIQYEWDYPEFILW